MSICGFQVEFSERHVRCNANAKTTWKMCLAFEWLGQCAIDLFAVALLKLVLVLFSTLPFVKYDDFWHSRSIRSGNHRKWICEDTWSWDGTVSGNPGVLSVDLSHFGFLALRNVLENLPVKQDIKFAGKMQMNVLRAANHVWQRFCGKKNSHTHTAECLRGLFFRRFACCLDVSMPHEKWVDCCCC